VKRISVILPVYNVQAYLSRCVDSLLAQTYPALEIWLVDDGSTDGTADLCDALAATDDRLRVIHKANGGVCSARNAGLEQATGEYIGFVDPDDWVAPDFYEVLVRALEDNAADAAFCGFWEQPEAGDDTLPVVCHAPEKQGVVDGSEALYQCLIGMGRGYFTAVWNKMFRRQALLNERGQLWPFTPGYAIAEDELWLTEVLPTLDRVALVAPPVYYWMQRTGSALRSGLQTDRWLSAIAAKEKAAALVQGDPRCAQLALGKIYNDIFHVVCLAYCGGDKDAMQRFMAALHPYKRPFLQSYEFSKAKKARFLVLEWMVRLHCPRRWVHALEQMTLVKLHHTGRQN